MSVSQFGDIALLHELKHNHRSESRIIARKISARCGLVNLKRRHILVWFGEKNSLRLRYSSAAPDGAVIPK